jgi:hypothetical protein
MSPVEKPTPQVTVRSQYRKEVRIDLTDIIDEIVTKYLRRYFPQFRGTNVTVSIWQEDHGEGPGHIEAIGVKEKND